MSKIIHNHNDQVLFIHSRNLGKTDFKKNYNLRMKYHAFCVILECSIQPKEHYRDLYNLVLSRSRLGIIKVKVGCFKVDLKIL